MFSQCNLYAFCKLDRLIDLNSFGEEVAWFEFNYLVWTLVTPDTYAGEKTF